MGIKYGDTSLAVRYIQAFLQDNYAKTVRVSGVYDEYTHSKLIEYLNLPKVLGVSDVIKVLSTYDKLLFYFKVLQTDSKITLTSKSIINGNKELNDFVLKLNKDIFNLAYECGWEVSNFITRDDNEKVTIIIKQSNRKNLIPKDCISLLNLNTDTYLSHFKIEDGAISKDSLDARIYNENHIIELVDCKPNTKYIITHRYDGMIPISIADSNRHINTDWNMLPNVNTNSKYLNYFVDCGQKIIYETSSTAKTLLVQIPKSVKISEPYTLHTNLYLGNLDYNDEHIITQESVNILKKYLEGNGRLTKAQAYMSHFVSILDTDNPYLNLSKFDLERMENLVGTVGSKITNYEYTIPSYTTTDDKILISEMCNVSNFNSNEFVDEYWKINSKFLTYITLMSINEYSRESDILTAMNMLNLLYPNENIFISGKFDDFCRTLIKDYQIKNNISFALGYIDSETEAKMNLSIDKNEKYVLSRE